MTGAGRLALFDLDNTLIDRQRAYRSWAEDFTAGLGLDGEATRYLLELDRDGFATREEVFGPFAERYRLAAGVEELVAAYRVRYPHFIEPEPGVAEALGRLRDAGWRRAIVTNGPPSQHEKIARAGLAGAFDATCVSADLGVEKPDRRIFAEAARRCGAELDAWGACWMVGDAPGPDVRGGADAGLRTLWIRRGRSWDEPDVEPDEVADSIPEAVELLISSS